MERFELTIHFLLYQNTAAMKTTSCFLMDLVRECALKLDGQDTNQFVVRNISSEVIMLSLLEKHYL